MRYSISTLFVLVFTLSSCTKKHAPTASSGTAPVLVDAVVMQPQAFENIVEANGTIMANEFVEIRSEISGRITSLNISEGNIVQAGTVLATLFNDDLEAQLRKSTSQLDVAQQNEQRLKQLLQINGVSQQQYDEALNTVTSLQADIDYTNAQLTKTKIVAPFTGVVGLRNVSLGAFVTSQDVITSVQQVNQLKIDFTLPESYGSIIKKNEEIQVTIDGREAPAIAVILAVEPQVNTATRNLKVRAVFKDKNIALNPGAFAIVKIDAGNKAMSLMIPSNAIIPDSRGNMLVLIKSGKAKFQLVKTGARNSGWVQVISGVQPGDTVAVNGILYLRPDLAVQLKSIKTYTELGYTAAKE